MRRPRRALALSPKVTLSAAQDSVGSPPATTGESPDSERPQTMSAVYSVSGSAPQTSTSRPAGFEFRVTGTDSLSSARLGRLTTIHGEIDTPAFMPVGTQATVKTLH